MTARLCIHARAHGVGVQGPLARLAGDLRNWWRGQGAWPAFQASSVAIDDLQGRSFFAANGVLPLIDVALPEGTYHVTLRRGAQQRRYTVTLEPGARVDLDLPPASSTGSGG